MKLGVNIDHVATLRQARRGEEPDILTAALIAQANGADQITVHLREDRRHIQDDDVRILKDRLNVPLNLEMALSGDIIEYALTIHPHKITIVPENREEITTEGGIDVIGYQKRITEVTQRFKSQGIGVSLFIEPDTRQIKASVDCGADSIEIHTGEYANSFGKKRKRALERIKAGVQYAIECGLKVHAGHGLTKDNVVDIARIEGIDELNIGHSIISNAVLYGLPESIRDIRDHML